MIARGVHETGRREILCIDVGEGRLSKVAAMLEDAEPEILACYAFPPGHWRKLRSTNPLGRFHKERPELQAA